MTLLKGKLFQNILIVVQGIDSRYDEKNKKEIKEFQRVIERHSVSIHLNITTVFIPQQVDKSDYHVFPDEGKIAAFKRDFDNKLKKAGIAAADFDGIIRLYRQDVYGMRGNTWKYYNFYLSPIGHYSRPGYSAIPVIEEPHVISHELMVHEYLHQLDHRFQEVQGSAGTFINPDWGLNFLKTLNQRDHPPHFYTNLLKHTTEKISETIILRDDNVQPAPSYRRLHGCMGRWLDISNNTWMTNEPIIRWNYKNGYFEKMTGVSRIIWSEHSNGMLFARFNEVSMDVEKGEVIMNDPERKLNVKIASDGNAYFAQNNSNNYQLLHRGYGWS